ncbi:hypothetical protein [Neptunitalea chrysea]|uniref:hypothetical protein n=1 Tax=Neptunitalea chrysea TaxID=1647581 RepID=UPI0024936385|nr:hypothetical protein [Neptunitalea chrysea]
MKQGLKHSIVYFFLIVFISIKLSNLHAFFHILENEKSKIEHCDVCKFTLTQDVTPVLSAESFSFEFLPQVQLPNNYLETYVPVYFNKLHSLTLYNKPPPFLS